MKKIFIVFLFTLGFAHLGFSQDATDMKFVNKLSGVVVVTGEGGVAVGQTDYRDTKIKFLGKGSLEYFIPTDRRVSFGLKLYGSVGNFGGTSTWTTPAEYKTSYKLIGAALSLTFPLGENFYPYMSLGYSHMWTDPLDASNDNNIVPGFKIMTWNPELGFRLMVSDNISVNLVGSIIAPISDGNEDKLDGTIRGSFKDYVVTGTIGLSYYIGLQKDEDNDGVVDSKDMCPGTPLGVIVDEFGCPVDSDGDGVADYLDKCPNTPAGVIVDGNGCPVDSDGDGVADYLDKCPNTPAGVTVDSNGCPVDSDGDGIADYLDKCPSTPSGANVDSNGCPDTDGDGVPDNLDKCPDTPKGTEVDANGCAKVTAPVTMSSDVNFAFDSAKLMDMAYPILDKVALSLKDNSNYNASIEGHTDYIGTDSYNMKLSLRRANSVADYLVSKGINRSNLKITGFGESKPIESNKTSKGRAANRRVEIKLNQK